MNNQAFIDGQNLHMNTTSHGWKVSLANFRTYLRDEKLLSPNKKSTSTLYKKFPTKYIDWLDNPQIKSKIEYR